MRDTRRHSLHSLAPGHRPAGRPWGSQPHSCRILGRSLPSFYNEMGLLVSFGGARVATATDMVRRAKPARAGSPNARENPGTPPRSSDHPQYSPRSQRGRRSWAPCSGPASTCAEGPVFFSIFSISITFQPRFHFSSFYKALSCTLPLTFSAMFPRSLPGPRRLRPAKGQHALPHGRQPADPVHGGGGAERRHQDSPAL